MMLSKKVKDTHKTMVTKDYGAIRGHVVSTSVMPIKDDLLKSSRADFAVTGQEIHRRRNTTNYETFDIFIEDLKSIVYVEAIFMDEQRQGDYFLACSCVNEKSESGVKGRLGSSRRTCTSLTSVTRKVQPRKTRSKPVNCI